MDQGFNHAAFTFDDPKKKLAKQMAQKQQTKGRGGFLTSLISELGGAGGAAGGAAIGAGLGSVVPVLGTAVGGLIGAGVGAFAGGTGGRIVENKVRDDRFGLGDALKEGATDAIFSGVGAANNIRKGAKAAKGLATATEGLSSPSDLLQAPQKVGLLEGIGKSLKTGASGYGTGAKVAGQDQLTSAGSDVIDTTLKTLKIPATAPETQARLLGNHIDNLGNILSKRYATSNTAVSPEDINTLGSNILGRVANTGGLSKGAEAFALEQAQKLAKAKDINDVWKFTKDIGRNSTNFGANADAKLVDKEAAARIIIDETRGFLNGKVPGTAETNDLYHKAKTAESFILNAARDKGGGLIQRMAGSAPVKAGEAKLGSTIENIGRYSAGTGGATSKFTNALKVQSPGAAYRGTTGLAQENTPQPAQNPQDLLGMGQSTGQSQSLTSDLLGQTNQGVDLKSQLLGLPPEQATSSSGMTLQSLQEALKQDYIDTGGKNSAALMQIAQLNGLVDNKGNPAGQASQGPNIGKPTAQQYGLATSGIQSLQNLSSLLQGDPSLLNKSATPGQGLPVVGGFVKHAAGTNQYDAVLTNLVDTMLRLRTGAAATKDEINMYKRQLAPTAGDTPQAIQSKLQQFYQAFAPFLGTNQSAGSSQDLLSQMNGGY